jgi:predicted metal-dependent phosphoesterase TrpH
VLKVELHAHSSDDPLDAIPHTTAQLIERVAEMGYDALALTLHDRQLDIGPYASLAAKWGVALIPGIERTIQGKHVLLLNFSRAAEDVRSFDDLAALKRREHGLVIAPHPFFPGSTCLRGLMDRSGSVRRCRIQRHDTSSQTSISQPCAGHTHGKPWSVAATSIASQLRDDLLTDRRRASRRRDLCRHPRRTSP